MTEIPDPRGLFDGIDTSSPVIVAVSGGSDSIALLLLASSWARASNVELQVVTVDHGLRPEAAAEAAFVAGVSEGLELLHVTLAWDGIKPGSGVITAARNARYRLLEEFARDIGASTILVGHTANDQAETILMRSARSANSAQTRGLSGMARTMILPRGTRVVRPLLGLSRKALRRHLSDYNQSWIEDPSNIDRAYERVRVREDLGDNPDRIAEICRFGDLMGRFRKTLSDAAAEILKDHVNVERGLVFSVDDAAFENVAGPVRTLVLQALIAIAGGAEYLVSEEVIDRISSVELNSRMTAGNAVIERGRGLLRFYREKRNLPAIIVGPGETVVWDGRLQIENKTSVSYFCTAPTQEQLKEYEQARGSKLPVTPRAALATTPFLCGEGDEIAMPFASKDAVSGNLKFIVTARAIEHFCSAYDFALLEFVRSIKSEIGSTAFWQS